MKTRDDVKNFCLSLDGVYEDYPFDDPNWTLMRHRSNKKTFAFIFERDDHIWVNVKNKPDRIIFMRMAYHSVVPAYHMNKTHWNSIILDGTIPDHEIMDMIYESYMITE